MLYYAVSVDGAAVQFSDIEDIDYADDDDVAEIAIHTNPSSIQYFPERIQKMYQ